MHVGPYEIVSELGQGGMGRVRLARAPDGRLVVLKNTLRDDADDDERLRDEARVGLRVRHPGVVETVELLEEPVAAGGSGSAGRTRPVLVTAFVGGVSFLDLRRSGPLPAVLVCRLGRQLAGALDAIHGIIDEEGRPLGVLHRDVTAGNCLLGDDGCARLIDFGIARSRESRALRTQTGLVRGTLRYLAPEIFAGGAYSPQSDLWSLGVVLFEALVGRAAVDGNDIAAMGRICVGDIMALQAGEAPDGRVMRALAQLLARRPDDRPRSAREAAALFAMIEKALAKESDDAGTTGLGIAAVARARERHAARQPQHAHSAGGALAGTLDLEIVDEETSAEFASAGLDVAVEPPFSHLSPTLAESATPRVGVPRAPTDDPPARHIAEELRAYAASLAAMEKQIDRAERAALDADEAQRDRRAALQDTALWAPPAGVTPPVVAAARVAPATTFATPPETRIVPAPAPTAPTPMLAPPTGVRRIDTASIDRMLDDFLHEEDTPTPSLAPAEQARSLEVLVDDTALQQAVRRGARRHALVRATRTAATLTLIGVGVVLAVVGIVLVVRVLRG